MNLTTELRRVIGIAAQRWPLTPRRQAAFRFLYCWLRVSREYGRPTFNDFRVQAARCVYARTCMLEWRKAA